jgi:NhaP-type Na+/H+ or K+/H+ antiporter
MSIASWALVIGVLLISMVLANSLIVRLPISNAMIYLGVGFLLGPVGFGVFFPDPMANAHPLQVATEIALVISIFATGLKLRAPAKDPRWKLPIRLAFPSMVLTVILIALLAYWGLGFSLGAAILLGGILAPTDPVLASSIQPEHGQTEEDVRFSLAGEGALNDGTAFPFVLLGLGLLGLHPLGENGWHWVFIDLLWPIAGGLAIGLLSGGAIGKLVVHLRARHGSALGLDEFLALGLIAVSYGLAQSILASGFLAVFAAGFAMNRVHETTLLRASDPTTPPQPVSGKSMRHSVEHFNSQMEKLAELSIVLVVGAMLPYVIVSSYMWWFIPVLFLVVRPLAVVAGTAGHSLSIYQTALIGWFGIRGIGSVFYLMLALHYGVENSLAVELIALTIGTVAVSILVHGITADPLMKWYVAHKAK